MKIGELDIEELEEEAQKADEVDSDLLAHVLRLEQRVRELEAKVDDGDDAESDDAEESYEEHRRDVREQVRERIDNENEEVKFV